MNSKIENRIKYQGTQSCQIKPDNNNPEQAANEEPK